MANINYNRTPEEEKALHSVITRRVTSLERSIYKKKLRFTTGEIVKRIRKIIEEEVNKA